jgi:type VI secretion system secreted protein VgrG
MSRTAKVVHSLAILSLLAGGAAAQVTRRVPEGTFGTQSVVRLSVVTPLGEGVLQPSAFEGREALSSLFSFQLDLVSESGRAIPFEALIGKEMRVTVSLAGGGTRHFHGLCSRFSQGDVDRARIYRAEIVPSFWLLTRRQGSRIFQEISVPEILRRVLAGVPGLAYEMRLQGTYHPRDYCVQYRESDFDFASRLMEEEGIFYFFTHTSDGHTMVLADTPQGHPDLPGPIAFRPEPIGSARAGTIAAWEKIQELRSGKYTLWDHHFELPGEHLEAVATIQDSVQVGGVLHRLAIADNDRLEIYDYPGGYAQRFDGIDPGGGERPEELRKIFEDARRTVQVRMQEEAAQSLLVRGASAAPVLAAGHKFSLTRHPDADGQYVLTSVQHRARQAADGQGGAYLNSFTCIPALLPYRPPRTTPKPVVPGTQTAVVTGPSGEEIFTDKYGRVKVQFHWDRSERRDEGSSGWVRVGALNAGTESGFLHIPRIGEEVVVAFEEGDPDRPIIVGSVYNAEHLPPLRSPTPPPAP